MILRKGKKQKRREKNGQNSTQKTGIPADCSDDYGGSHDYFRDTVSGRAVSCNSGGSSKDVGNVDIHGYDV